MKQTITANRFTLIELLVVIAILSILASLLLPVIERAKSQAKKVTCLANMRQLHVGTMLYAEDNRGTFPVGNPQGTSGIGRDYGMLKSRSQEAMIKALWGGERQSGPCTIPSSISHDHPIGNVDWYQWEDPTAYMGSMGLFLCPNTYEWRSEYTGKTFSRDLIELGWTGTYEFWFHPKRKASVGGSPIKISQAAPDWWHASERVHEEEDYTKPYHVEMEFHVNHMDGRVDTHRVQSNYSLPNPSSAMHTDKFCNSGY